MAVEWKQSGDEWDAFANGVFRVTVFPVSKGVFADAFMAVIQSYRVNRQLLAATDIDDAKAEALGIARRMLVEAVEALGEEK